MMLRKCKLLIVSFYFCTVSTSHSINQYMLQLLVSNISVGQPKECMNDPKCFKMKITTEFDGKQMSPTDGHTIDLRSLKDKVTTPTKIIYSGISDKMFTLNIGIERSQEKKSLRIVIDKKAVVKMLQLTKIQSEPKSFGVTGLGYPRNISFKYHAKLENLLSNAMLRIRCHEEFDDDIRGHYVCGIHDQKVCRKGYGNPENNCKDPFCDFAKCLNNGTCSREKQECICTTGFVGQYCQYYKAICLYNNPCDLKKSTCIDLPLNRTIRCACKPGYYGKKCTKLKDICGTDALTCKNGGNCTTIKGVKKCQCPDSYEGFLCEKDKNECQNRSLYCKFATGCINTIGGYICQCSKPAYGPNCDKCDRELDENGLCSLTINEKLFWPAIIIGVILILASSVLSGYYWTMAVKSAKWSNAANMGHLLVPDTKPDA